MRPAVFLDRDDTLIRCRSVAPDGDLGDPALVRLVDGAREACGGLRDAGFALVVVSNQGGVARGKYPLEAVDAVNRRLNDLLGGLIDRFYYCPYHPKGTVPAYTREHAWRKPSPGMLTQAAIDLGLDLERSWMIGDAERDIEAGRSAGCRTILIAPKESKSTADFVVPTIAHAGAAILLFETARETLRESPSTARDLMASPNFAADVLRRLKPGKDNER